MSCFSELIGKFCPKKKGIIVDTTNVHDQTSQRILDVSIHSDSLGISIHNVESNNTTPVLDNTSLNIVDEVYQESLSEPVIDLAKENTIESITNTILEPVTESVTEHITESVTEPITEPASEPITEPITEPVTEPITEPIIEQIQELVTGTIPVSTPVSTPTSIRIVLGQKVE
jgi:hypothetical protein